MASRNYWANTSSAVLSHLVPRGSNVSVYQFHKGLSQAAQPVLAYLWEGRKKITCSKNILRKLLNPWRQSKVPRIHQPELNIGKVHVLRTHEAKSLLMRFSNCWHQGITSMEISRPCLLLQSINTEWLVDKSQGHQAKSSGCLLLHTAGYKLRACPPLL